eukprot:TRINITY_DN24841_c0_g1_i1.p1 TRINITY_DN24841_c0_g1~~TRINITY_DN24841_c0_g1_i1.p1  ORF type:complete len:157 (+),score=35.51 TRINITY_DN24841_c0_g1_i1:31-471(+)
MGGRGWVLVLVLLVVVTGMRYASLVANIETVERDVKQDRRIEPWEGVEVKVGSDMIVVKQMVEKTPSAGWKDAMAGYCGHTGRVTRYDTIDRQDGVVRVTHYDGKSFTWPIIALTVQGSSGPSGRIRVTYLGHELTPSNMFVRQTD